MAGVRCAVPRHTAAFFLLLAFLVDGSECLDKSQQDHGDECTLAALRLDVVKAGRRNENAVGQQAVPHVAVDVKEHHQESSPGLSPAAERVLDHKLEQEAEHQTALLTPLDEGESTNQAGKQRSSVEAAALAQEGGQQFLLQPSGSACGRCYPNSCAVALAGSAQAASVMRCPADAPFFDGNLNKCVVTCGAQDLPQPPSSGCRSNTGCPADTPIFDLGLNRCVKFCTSGLRDLPTSAPATQCKIATAGTCRFTQCGGSYGLTSCVGGTCYCNPGHCVGDNGICQLNPNVAQAPPGCQTVTQDTCRWLGCRAPNTMCHEGRCMCQWGHCVQNGVCVKSYF